MLNKNGCALVFKITPSYHAKKIYENIFKTSESNGLLMIDNLLCEYKFVSQPYEHIYNITFKENSIILMKIICSAKFSSSIEWEQFLFEKEIIENWVVETCKHFDCSYNTFIFSILC